MGASGSAPRGPGARTEHTSATGPFRPCRGRCGPGQTGWAGGGVGKGATLAGVVRTDADDRLGSALHRELRHCETTQTQGALTTRHTRSGARGPQRNHRSGENRN